MNFGNIIGGFKCHLCWTLLDLYAKNLKHDVYLPKGSPGPPSPESEFRRTVGNFPFATSSCQPLCFVIDGMFTILSIDRRMKQYKYARPTLASPVTKTTTYWFFPPSACTRVAIKFMVALKLLPCKHHAKATFHTQAHCASAYGFGLPQITWRVANVNDNRPQTQSANWLVSHKLSFVHYSGVRPTVLEYLQQTTLWFILASLHSSQRVPISLFVFS